MFNGKEGRKPTSKAPSSADSPGSRPNRQASSPTAPNPALTSTTVFNPTLNPAHVSPPVSQSTAPTNALPPTTTTAAPAAVLAPPDAQPTSAPVPTTSIAPNTELSDEEQNQIDLDFQLRLMPTPSFRTLRRHVLEWNAWDLTAAHAQYTRVLRRIAENRPPQGTLPPGFPGPMRPDGILYRAMHARGLHIIMASTSIEVQHRELANRLRHELRLRPTPVHPSLTEVVLILYENKFDLDNAMTFLDEEDAAFATLHEAFDRFRPSLGSNALATTQGPIQERQDASLAHLASITGRPDWFSLRTHLMNHHWNLVRAVETWYRDGIPFTEPPTRGLTKHLKYRQNYKQENLAPPSKDETEPSGAIGGWSREKPEFMTKKAYEDGLLLGNFPEPEEQLRQSKASRGKIPFGYTIDRDGGEDILPGPPDHKRMIYEYIRMGKYQTTRFKSGKFIYPELDPHGNARQDGDPPEFDWSDSEHISELNKWRKQAERRVTGILARDPSQRWTEEENKYLFDLHLERLNELKEKNKDKTEKELLEVEYGMSCMDAWADSLNQRFPRDRPREGRAVDTQRRRIAAICKRFAVKGDPKFVKDDAQGEDGENEDEDKQDGEIDEDGGEEPSTGEKRQRGEGDDSEDMNEGDRERKDDGTGA